MRVVALPFRKSQTLWVLTIGLTVVVGWPSFVVGESRALRASEVTATIPFELVNHKIILPVRINASSSYDFMLDTGSPVMLLTSPEIAPAMRLATDQPIRLTGAGRGKSPRAFMAEPATVVLPATEGEVQLVDQRVVILAEDPGFATFMGVESFGIVGQGLFERFVVVIDFDRELITLYEPETFSYDGSGEIIPIWIRDGHPHCRATLELPGGKRHELDAVIDTGAGTALTVIENRRLGLTAPADARLRRLGRGLNGEIQGAFIRAPRLQLGAIALRDVVTAFADHRTKIAPGAQANIGADVLRRFRVIFDYSKGQMILEPGVAFKKSFEVDMSGLRLRAEGVDLDQLLIEEVREGSPAAAIGLEIGDRILSLEGQRMSLPQASKLLRRRDGHEVQLEIERAGSRSELRLILMRDI